MSNMEDETLDPLDYKPYKGQFFNGRYTIIDKLGSGAFSTVWRCIDEETVSNVAIKIQKSMYSSILAAKTEVKILKNLSHKNIIKLIDKFIYYDLQPTTRKHYCLVYELCDSNLQELMTLYYEEEANDINFIKSTFKQILVGIAELHKHQIIHTDIKPENILMKGNVPKISDFGTSDYQYRIDSQIVGTRYYRSPEVILGCNLTIASDIWSLGILLFELMTGDILFNPKTYISWNINRDEDHLGQINELLGPIPKWMKNGKRGKKFFNKFGEFRHINQLLSSSLEGLLKNKYFIKDKLFIDLINKMLIIDPLKRITINECINHKWLN
jgi:dual specificity tyrosine-phosphorylation-regulated kinase 2/3/4